tara:strand:+ start:858 stop:1253 length:396 start_codon:yes stop_codon:yes gene_type:complete
MRTLLLQSIDFISEESWSTILDKSLAIFVCLVIITGLIYFIISSRTYYSKALSLKDTQIMEITTKLIEVQKEAIVMFQAYGNKIERDLKEHGAYLTDVSKNEMKELRQHFDSKIGELQKDILHLGAFINKK